MARLFFILLLGVFFIPTSHAKDFYRVIYSDDAIRFVGDKNKEKGPRKSKRDDNKLGLERNPLVEEGYGSLYVVVPSKGHVPKKPFEVNGTLIHSSADDDGVYVIGNGTGNFKKDNPALAMEPVAEELGDKWAEYEFLKKFASNKTLTENIAPPEMHLGSDYVNTKDLGTTETLSAQDLKNRLSENLSEQKRDALEAKIHKILYQITPEKIEEIRVKIQNAQGKSILKVREGFHSEGRLPKTHKDWKAIWKNYLAETRPEILKQKAKLAKSSTELQNVIWNWEHIEGAVLEQLVLDPKQVVVQKMIEIEKEVRVHVVEGKVLSGASFLRMYPLGTFLTAHEIKKVEESVSNYFLKNLIGAQSTVAKMSYDPFSCSPDIAVEKGTGKLYILDLNPGFYSGYLYPEEDLFTTNLLAAHYLDKKTPFLEAFEDVKKARTLEEKGTLLAKLTDHYSYFIKYEGEDHESFWDKVIRHTIDKDIAEAPEKERRMVFDRLLVLFKEAGLRSPSIYYQFINEVQNEYKINLGARAFYWQKFFMKLPGAKDYRIEVDQEKIIMKEIEKAEASKSKKAA